MILSKIFIFLAEKLLYMKNRSKELFDLVKSLKKEEIGRLNQEIGLMGKRGEVHKKILRVIGKYDVYEHILWHKVLKISNPSAAKKRLYDLVLNTCTFIQNKKQEEQKSKIDIQIHYWFSQYYTLLEKSLISQASTKLSEIEGYAIENEAIWIMPLIEKVRISLEAQYLRYMNFNEESIKELTESLKKTGSTLQKLIDIHNVGILVSFYHHKEIQLKFEKPINHFVDVSKINIETNDPNKLKSHYYQTLGMYYSELGQPDKSINYFKLNLDIVRISKDREYKLYINSMNNLIVSMILNQSFDDVEVYIDEYARELPNIQDTLNIDKYFRACLIVTRLTKDIKQGNKYIRQFKQYEHKIKHHARHIYVTYYNIAIVCFHMEKYDEAIKYIENAIYSEYIRDKEQKIASIFQIIILYEQNNFLLLESKIKSIYRKILQHGEALYFERFILNSMKRLIYADKQQKQVIYKKIKEELESLRQNKDKQLLIKTHEIIDYIHWIDTKL